MTDIPPFGTVAVTTGSIEDVPRVGYPIYAHHPGGWLISKPTYFGEAVVPVAPPAAVQPIKSPGTIWLNDKRVPGYIVHQATAFFRHILELHGTEAAVILTVKDDRWRIFVPEQYVTRGGVNMKYDPAHVSRGWTQIGTIHSHCDFSAFHSGVDQHDADGFEGVHITIGMLDRPEPEYAQMLAFNKVHITLSEEQAIDWADLDGPLTAPAWWDRYVHKGPGAPWGNTGISWTPTVKPVQQPTWTPPNESWFSGYDDDDSWYQRTQHQMTLLAPPKQSTYKPLRRPVGMTQIEWVAFLLNDIHDQIAGIEHDLDDIDFEIEYTIQPRQEPVPGA